MKTLLITGASGMVGRNVKENVGASEYALLIPTSTELNLLDKNAVEAYHKG